jgi:hypothetical protein
MLVEASVNAAAPFTLPSEDRIQPSSLELERRVEPWCPGDCAVGVPFVASYRKGTERLVVSPRFLHATSVNTASCRSGRSRYIAMAVALILLIETPHNISLFKSP